MIKTRFSSGMWRVDPLNRTRVVDRCGRTIANAESEADASLIASAPDMYEVLDSIENSDTIQVGLWEHVQFVLRRARGDIGLIFLCLGYSTFRNLWNQQWLKFIEGLCIGNLQTGDDRQSSK
jgi:hypothetical protein